MRVLFLNPYHGGSHGAFAEGWLRHTRHDFDLRTLPARFWKWRMRGAALHFAREVKDPGRYDALVTTDLMSLSDLKALWGPSCPPALAYFHENQLSYPLPPGETLDVQFGFTDITTCLAARRVLFNSSFHRETFMARLPEFLAMMPEHRPRWVVEEIAGRSGVLHPGVDVPAGPVEPAPRDPGLPPLVIWNHRWEFDKRPVEFFAALDAALSRGAEFRLALLGENFQVVPKPFLAARERYGARIVCYGFVESRAEYLDWLRRGDVVVSTAEQENFGMSIIEAIRMGCRPLVPRRLSYPEVIPEEFHADCLYDESDDLGARLAALLTAPRPWPGARDAPGRKTGRLAEAMGRYAWSEVVGAFDAEVDALREAAASERH